MNSVGIRELKNRLSEYVRRVERGECFLITDRGEVVAELVPPHGATHPEVPEGVWVMVRQGKATLGSAHDATLYRPQARTIADGETGQALDESRGDL
ncbi:MAG TPA: type II toxin-antitoxin system prevent-host-death family antitoxin [Candidatus Xenobia bacterium]|jgi:prevent-host-death family protein